MENKKKNVESTRIDQKDKRKEWEEKIIKHNVWTHLKTVSDTQYTLIEIFIYLFLILCLSIITDHTQPIRTYAGHWRETMSKIMFLFSMILFCWRK